jgi:AraC-like DNA-binding protein
VSDWTTLWANFRSSPAAVAVVVGLVMLLLAGWLIARLTRLRGEQAGQRRIRGRAVENFLTLAAAGVATGVAAVGMWRFFGDVLQIRSVLLRSALFAFLEIALFVSAIRARRNLLDDLERITAARAAAEQARSEATSDRARAEARVALSRVGEERASTGVDGIAVWALAAMSGTFAALDARSFPEAMFRLAAPLVAAWLWERGLAAHRRQHRSRSAINWTMTPRRVLVKLGWAEPTGRGVGEVDAARRKARLARTAYRLHTLKAARAWSWRITRADRALRRQVEQANEHLGLATNPAVRAEIRVHLATLYQMVTGTSPESVRDLAPWSSESTAATPGRVNAYDPEQHAEELAAVVTRLIEARLPEAMAAVAAVLPAAPVVSVEESFAQPVPVGASSAVSEEALVDGGEVREVEETEAIELPVPEPTGALPTRALPSREERSSELVLGDQLPAPARHLVPAPARPVPPPPVSGTAVPAERRVTARATEAGQDAPVSVKWQAFALLDDQVAPDDSRSQQELARLIVDRLGAQLGTARRYEREWRNQLAAGQRPNAKARRLRVVPSSRGESDR